jgi:demethylmenaquinone methyltransferase/2-methoxy-6-polyprenyl-1,4-benzoquinol methylase
LSVDAYRFMARMYDPATAFALDPIRRLTRDVLLGLGARRVLDVCCGTGRQTLVLRRAGIDALGVDASPAMLAVARKTAPPSGGAPFGRMDARRLAFADASFDAAVITFALHENEEPNRLAMGREMARVVRPGGHLLLVDYASPSGPSAMGWLVTLAERLAGTEHYRNYRDFMLKTGVAGFSRRLGRETLATHPCLGGRAALLVLSLAPAP